MYSFPSWEECAATEGVTWARQSKFKCIGTVHSGRDDRRLGVLNVYIYIHGPLNLYGISFVAVSAFCLYTASETGRSPL